MGHDWVSGYSTCGYSVPVMDFDRPDAIIRRQRSELHGLYQGQEGSGSGWNGVSGDDQEVTGGHCYREG